MQIITQFLNPCEDNINCLFLGDNVDEKDFNSVKSNFKFYRDSFLPACGFECNGDVLTKKYGTSEIFRGALDEYDMTKTIVFLDADLTKNLIHVLLNNPNSDEIFVDELEAMLIDKYVMDLKCRKYIMDISKTPIMLIQRFYYGLDTNIDKFNYIIDDTDKFIGLIFLEPDNKKKKSNKKKQNI